MERVDKINPIIKMDYPDPDVIRVGDTFYMASTTMHFFPGCAILRSYDLVNWEILSYVYDRLDSTKAQRMEDGGSIYGQGMWAPSLRYHKGTFYVCFAANDTHKTYLYTAKTAEGPWDRKEIEGFYHDSSLLFDEDDRVYIVYGNTEIHLTELKADLSGPLLGGLDRVIIREQGNRFLGYEGSHIYKINGRYYVFLIHSRKDRWMRVQACYVAESLTGEFTGGDVFEETRGYCGQGVAQGGIVDTPEGDWYAVLFQDHGAVGRIPVLVPMRFEDGFPVMGENGRIPDDIAVKSTRPDYVYAPLYESDDFDYPSNESGKAALKKVWQFNHEPVEELWEVRDNTFRISTGKLCQDLVQAQNTLTQRLLFPKCRVEVTLDVHSLNDGDYAGLCVLQGCYGMIAVKKEEGKTYLVMGAKETRDESTDLKEPEREDCREYERILLESQKIKLYLEADFWQMKDQAVFGYVEDGISIQVGGVHRLFFGLDHFCGARAGLFMFSTKQIGGTAMFSDFIYSC